ncbi:hypothetical protein E0K93_09465 [Puniceibacterium sp. HSS470]|nr:hypothetical protein E0K93_09465 [Puniceibacterium sp. HSS470]|tara:strand:- start:21730 stop:21999 length:270 start_codon:yes stop_codon:yes gene_type:complete
MTVASPRNPLNSAIVVDIFEPAAPVMSIVETLGYDRIGEPEIRTTMTINRSAMEFEVFSDPPRRFRVSLKQLTENAVSEIRAMLQAEQP